MQRGDGIFAPLLLLALRAPTDRARLATERHALRVRTVNASQSTTWLGCILELISRKSFFLLHPFAKRTLQLLALLAQERLDARQSQRHVLRVQL